MSRNRGTISIETANSVSKNVVDRWSEVMQWKVPRGYFAQFLTGEAINLYLPTSVTVAHGGAGEEDLDLNADGPIVDSAQLTDDLTVTAYDPDDNVLSVTAVDYANNQVTVDHDTAEDVEIVYLAQGGSARLNVYRPSAGTQTFNLFEKSITTLHLMEQDNTDSLLTLDYPFPAPEKFLVKLEVNAPYEIAWKEDASNKVAHVSIPFRKKSMRYLTQDHMNKISDLFVSK